MELTGKVVAVESGSAYTDGVPRITIQIEEAANWCRKLILPNEDKLTLDDDVHVQISVRRPRGKGN